MLSSQSSMLRPLVEEILQQCAALHRFHLDSEAPPVYRRQGDSQLQNRALLRARQYQPVQDHAPELPLLDVHYGPRDSTRSAGCADAYEAALYTWNWSLDICVSPDLSARLQEWPSIQGYIHTFETHLLSNLINLEPASNWGSLFRFCQQVQGEHNKAKLMFLFRAMAFGGQIDMALLRTLIAIAVMDQAQDLQLPQCTEFIRFRRGHIPTVELLAQYIRPHRIPYPGDERVLLGVTMHGKQRRKLEATQRQHEEVSAILSPLLRRFTMPRGEWRKSREFRAPCLRMSLLELLADLNALYRHVKLTLRPLLTTYYLSGLRTRQPLKGHRSFLTLMSKRRSFRSGRSGNVCQIIISSLSTWWTCKICSISADAQFARKSTSNKVVAQTGIHAGRRPIYGLLYSSCCTNL